MKVIDSEPDGDILDYNWGTVTWIDLEGGFWGIITDENLSLDPINLDKTFKIKENRIEFYYVKADVISFHMWGLPVTVSEVRELFSPASRASIKMGMEN